MSYLTGHTLQTIPRELKLEVLQYLWTNEGGYHWCPALNLIRVLKMEKLVCIDGLSDVKIGILGGNMGDWDRSRGIWDKMIVYHLNSLFISLWKRYGNDIGVDKGYRGFTSSACFHGTLPIIKFLRVNGVEWFKGRDDCRMSAEERRVTRRANKYMSMEPLDSLCGLYVTWRYH